MTPNIFLKNRSGIYGIRNKTNNKIYVGKTKCMYRRCQQYIYDFENRRIGHLNDHLYNSIRKSGLSNFEFFPLEFAETDSLSHLELKWMVDLQSTDRNKGYNLRQDSSTGMICDPETSLKISANLKDQWSKGVRQGHSEKMKRYWSNNNIRRNQQSELLTRHKTRYEYHIFRDENIVEKCNYSRLKELKLHSVLSNFHRKKCNTVEHKGYTIIRVVKGE